MAKIEPLNNEAHKDLKIKMSNDVSELAHQSILPLVLGEFSHAAIEFPICFIRGTQSSELQVVALMGIESKENLFVVDGKWDAAYMPARYTHRPFGLMQNPNDENNFSIAIDVESKVVSKEEGTILFEENGDESEFLTKQKDAMRTYLEQEQMTKLFAKELEEKGLLVQRQVNIEVKGKKFDIDGISMVDEQKVQDLSDEDFIELRKRGIIGPLYTHLLSMRQMNNLIKRKSEKLESAAA